MSGSSGVSWPPAHRERPDHASSLPARGARRPLMANGPTVRRRRLGTELRRLRESSGYKLEEVSAQLGVAPSTLSRIETGKAPTKSAYLSQMLEKNGVVEPAQRQVIIDMAGRGPPEGLVGRLQRRSSQRVRNLRGPGGRDGVGPRLRGRRGARAAADARL